MPQTFRGLCAVGAAAAVLTAATQATAQVPSLDARTWRPSTDPNASLVIEPAVTPGPGVLSIGAYSHYSFQPVSLKRAGTDDVALRPLQHSLGLDAVANLGIGQRLALGLAVPVILYQDGTRPLPPSVSQVDATPSTGIGDLGLSVKGSILRNENGGFGLAGLGYVTLPTGDRASFAGEGSTTVSLRVLAEYTLIVAMVQASIGYKMRTDNRTWPAASAGGYTFGDEVPWSLGLGFRPGLLGVDSGNRQRWEVAAHGWLPAGPVGPFGGGDPGSAALSPVMLAMSDRIELGHYRDAYMIAGVEFGLTEAVGVPAFRGVLSIGWAPREHDMDHDGVKDDVDGCPEIPEDKDGFEDSDGCPEIDNDDDGIIDKEDACPNVKGVPSSDPKKNGCPANDQDGDGIDDSVDACPAAKGVKTNDPKTNGCPGEDSDGDGIPDYADKCPTQPEDKDGFQDDDGCPDPDNDGDGIADKDDACPDKAGEPSTDPARNGCPNDDRDGDTIENSVDKCPDSAEVFNGVDDEDGCPDEGGKPLVVIDDKKVIKLAAPLKLVGGDTAPDVDPASIPTLRAIALELNRHRDWTLAVGVRPGAGDPSKAQLDALAKSFAVVRVLAGFAHRDGAAESIGWDAVKNRPGAESGVGLVILGTSAPAAVAPTATPAGAAAPGSGPAPAPAPLPAPAPKP